MPTTFHFQLRNDQRGFQCSQTLFVVVGVFFLSKMFRQVKRSRMKICHIWKWNICNGLKRLLIGYRNYARKIYILNFVNFPCVWIVQTLYKMELTIISNISQLRQKQSQQVHIRWLVWENNVIKILPIHCNA